jgi:hypothetical protein
MFIIKRLNSNLLKRACQSKKYVYFRVRFGKPPQGLTFTGKKDNTMTESKSNQNGDNEDAIIKSQILPGRYA